MVTLKLIIISLGKNGREKRGRKNSGTENFGVA
jgi:hypothetical protein